MRGVFGIKVEKPAPPLQGFFPFVLTQGFGRAAASALGCAVARFQRFD
jgi:hypothetical protein